MNSWSILALFRVSGPSSVVPLYCQRWDKMKLPWFGSRRAQRRLGDEMIWNVGCEATGFRNSAGARVTPPNKWPFQMEKMTPNNETDHGCHGLWIRGWHCRPLKPQMTPPRIRAESALKMGLGALDLTPLKGRAEKAPPSKWFPETKEVEIGKWSELIELIIVIIPLGRVRAGFFFKWWFSTNPIPLRLGRINWWRAFDVALPLLRTVSEWLGHLKPCKITSLIPVSEWLTWKLLFLMLNHV